MHIPTHTTETNVTNAAQQLLPLQLHNSYCNWTADYSPTCNQRFLKLSQPVILSIKHKNYSNVSRTAKAANVSVYVPVKELSSSHQLQHQSNVCVCLKDLLQLDLSHRKAQEARNILKMHERVLRVIYVNNNVHIKIELLWDCCYLLKLLVIE